jgi:hypothetical protein
MNVHSAQARTPALTDGKDTTRQVNMTISLAFLTPDLVEACRDIAAGSTR